MEELIDFDTAKLAFEKGFKWISSNNTSHFERYHVNNKFVPRCPIGVLREEVHREDSTVYLRPTQSLLQKWLREEHQIIIFVQHETIDDSESAFTYTIKKYVKEGLEGSRKKDEPDFWYVKHSFLLNSGWWSTYEGALEQGLLKALINIPDS